MSMSETELLNPNIRQAIHAIVRREVARYLGIRSDEVDITKEQVTTVREVQAAVCAHFELSRNDLIANRRRDKDVMFPRQIAMYLAHKYTLNSLPVLGRLFNRHHSSILHGVNKIAALMEKNGPSANIVREIESTLNFKEAESQ